VSLRPWQTFAIFAACALVLFGGVGWISITALELDRAEREARAAATHEENIRLALWRMDSTMAPIIGTESARPYFVYRSFFSADLPYERMLERATPNDRMVASPLLAGRPAQVKLHFAFEGGVLTSPQVPTGRWLSMANGRGIEPIANAESLLGELSGLDQRALQAGLRTNRVAPPPPKPKQRPSKSSVEWTRRSKIVQQASSTYNADFNQVLAPPTRGLDGAPQSTAMAPKWIDDRLLLVRKPTIGGRDYLQGVWLDWTAIRTSLIAEVRDLLPQADVVAETAPTEGRSLAALPVALVPGAGPAIDEAPSLTVVLVLALAWFGVLLAAAAAAALLLGATALGERRAEFVSAVTHELRTPLTTFRMYTEMLADGMVRDEAKRAKYLETLRAESIRLSHLVENVLSYARIERGREGSKRELLSLVQVVERFGERLEDRATQARMTLEIDLPKDDLLEVVGDGGAVEQILFNLVDNACKYACKAEDRRIIVRGRRRSNRVELSVHDHGPGVSSESARRLFSPFSKSAERAATSAPGVGLGLALCRRLARAMGGDLVHGPSDGGATFVFRLPYAAAGAPAGSARSDGVMSR